MITTQRLTDDCENDCSNCGEAKVVLVEVDKAGNVSDNLSELFCEHCEDYNIEELKKTYLKNERTRSQKNNKQKS